MGHVPAAAVIHGLTADDKSEEGGEREKAQEVSSLRTGLCEHNAFTA
jgi:hypothetical protein